MRNAISTINSGSHVSDYAGAFDKSCITSQYAWPAGQISTIDECACRFAGHRFTQRQLVSWIWLWHCCCCVQRDNTYTVPFANPAFPVSSNEDRMRTQCCWTTSSLRAGALSSCNCFQGYDHLARICVSALCGSDVAHSKISGHSMHPVPCCEISWKWSYSQIW